MIKSLLSGSAFALLATGCSPASMVRSATPEAVKGGAEGIADPQTEKNLAKAMESPEMKEAISALAKDIGGAALDVYEEEPVPLDSPLHTLARADPDRVRR